MTTRHTFPNKMNPSSSKFLLVGFDGLRPEMMTQELMPNLHRHAARGDRKSVV